MSQVNKYAPPKVSVLVCSKNRRAALLRCLDSLAAQTYPHDRMEIVVVEEAPDEAALPGGDHLDGISVNHVPIPPHRKGYGYPRRLAVEQARYELLAFLDDDCEAEADWLCRLVTTFAAHDCEGVAGAVLARNPGVLGLCELAAGFPGGGVRYLHQSGGRPMRTNLLSTCNALLKKDAVRAAGNFREGLRFGGEDSLLAAKISRGERRFVYQPAAVVYHATRDSWLRIAGWFFRRGRAAVDVAHKEPGAAAYSLWTFVTTSVLVRLGLAGAAAALLGSAWVFVALFAAYCAALGGKYRFLVAHFKGPGGAAALVCMPFVRLWMDAWFELGAMVQAATGAAGFSGRGTSSGRKPRSR